MPGLIWWNPLTWPVEPVLLLAAEIAVILYLFGAPAARRPPSARWGPARWRSLAFYAGIGVILLSLNGPVEAYARTLFWVHMSQHLLLITVAAPLLVLSAPGLRLWRGLPLKLRRPLARTALRAPRLKPLRAAFAFVTAPIPVWVLAAANLWLWHLPALYDLTLRHHLVHHLEHTLFLGLGLLFWAQVIDQPPFHSALSQFQRLMYAFTATIASWVLAALLGLSSAAFYAYADLPVRPGGITALTDQQIGAGIMWVPGSIAYSILIIWCVMLWLRDEERAAEASVAAHAHGVQAP
ncbi:MAG TPA: cytochrome c oxidase assembly protein [Candidatus Limnocylindrales bacterium]|nr:cytochrome c oxidase assembly protein [Candidatus Limnocylindrales bacterium]